MEFWDFCRVHSLRTLPYLKAWHARYASRGLRVLGVHVAGYPCSQDPEAVAAAVARLGIEYAVVVDVEGEIWTRYGVEGWPSRYLWDREGALRDVHFGEGGYAESERAIQDLLGLDEPLLEPLRAGDEPGALLPAPTPEQPGAYSGPYAAGGVWGVFEGEGQVAANGRAVAVDGPGCYPLLEHEHHTEGVIALEPGAGVLCHATCFVPAPAPPRGTGSPVAP